MVNKASYQTAYDEALEEFRVLQEKREKIDDRLDHLKGIILGFARLMGDAEVTDSVTDETGMTASIAKALRVSGKWLYPSEVRDELVRMGFDTKRYKAIIPSIVKVLERLHKKGHVNVAQKVSISGRKIPKNCYRWNPMQPRTLASSFSQDELIVNAIKERKNKV